MHGPHPYYTISSGDAENTTFSFGLRLYLKSTNQLTTFESPNDLFCGCSVFVFPKFSPSLHIKYYEEKVTISVSHSTATKMKEALLYLQARLIQLQQGWSVPAASNALASRKWDRRKHTACVGGCCSVHDAALGYTDNVGCYELFVFERACPSGNSEVVDVMRLTAKNPQTHTKIMCCLSFSCHHRWALPLLQFVSLNITLLFSTL